MILRFLLLALAGGDPSLAAIPTSCREVPSLPAPDSARAAETRSSAPDVSTVAVCTSKPDESELRRQRALRHLDELRRAAGAGGLVRSELLGLSASRHAAYLSRNGFRSVPTVHAETEGLPGFTGADPFVRMRTAGYRMSYATELIGDVGSHAVDTDCLVHLMNTVYHAALLLSRVTEAGVAYGEGSAAGMCIIDLAAPVGASDMQTPGSGEIVRYPWPGMVAATGTYLVGSENPRPPPSLLPNANAGIPVLVGLRNADFVSAAAGAGVEIQRFELSDAHGLLVPGIVFADRVITGPGIVADIGLHGVFAAFVPQLPLEPGRYRVTLRATIAGTHAIAPPAWFFSVAAP